MKPIRNSAKAIIIRNGKLLCIKLIDNNGPYFILPGGGQDKYETFVETIKRECKEELGIEVNVIKLKYVREYIGKYHEFKNDDSEVHQIEYMFQCDLLTDPNLEIANHLDARQIGYEWIDINKKGNKRVYPKILMERLRSNYDEIYWGDIN